MTHTFTIGESDFLLDGKPFVIRCGEIHFTRVPPELWTHRLKMCRAMGLNTVCVYLFWNFHEWEEGQFDWSGWADVAQFCRLAQEEGLWVLLRPGPYSCAEWEMGGLPWWLVKRDGVGLRTMDAAYLEPATRYLREVGRVLAPLQITNGGPLLMVQVENEYGSFGDDADYMGACRDALLEGGFEVPLFACNPAHDLKNGWRDDLFQVVNFGPGSAKAAFETLHELQPRGPQMNGEYYPAWFDTWGRPHHKGHMDAYLSDLDYMLENDHSFSIYMAHGGTSFGLWAGADRPFRPDTSSYDYAAPISEAGWVTEKFWRSREVFERHLSDDETLPAPPDARPIIEIAPFRLNQSAPIWDNLPAAIADETPQTMEFYDQSRGCILYRCQIPVGEAAILEADAVHDFGWVFLNGEKIGVLDRRGGRFRLTLPAREAAMQLDILVEAMGRINFGREVFDRKGLHAPVTLDGHELRDWQIFPLPLDQAQLGALRYDDVAGDSSHVAGQPAFWRGEFEIEAAGDTFLDMRPWGKGVVWVNGHCLGRFWNIGPAQTMYCPGVWLHSGANQIVVLDLLGTQSPTVTGLRAPILDELRPELDFSRPARAAGTFDSNAFAPVATGAFSPAVTWQDIEFDGAPSGRYLCLESLSAHDDKPFAAVAELDVIDANGQSLSRVDWKAIWADSEEISEEDGTAENAIDGQAASAWHTDWSSSAPNHPHQLVIDLGNCVEIGAVRYLPRGGKAGATGRIKNYRLYLSDTPFNLHDLP